MRQALNPSFFPSEKKTIFGLCMVIGVRMLGLFMLLPVLALYADSFDGSTPFLIGLAVGIYGLTQAILQIPFGMASDRIGRIKVLYLGLFLFALGSVLSAQAVHIWSLITGRALQGAGAISAVGMALMADVTREELRIRAMAILGSSIGLAFIVAIITGPILSAKIGVNGIFWLSAILAILAMMVVAWMLPKPATHSRHLDIGTHSESLKSVLIDSEIMRLNGGIFVLHLTLTACFVAIPIQMSEQMNLPISQHGWLYLGTMFLGVLIMFPMIFLVESKAKIKQIFLTAIAMLVISQLGLYLANVMSLMIVVLTLFFASFNLLEALLPSLISQSAPVQIKGTAMGVYASMQFFGAFVGGAFGGAFMGWFADPKVVFLMNLSFLLVWFVLAFSMKKPNSLGTNVLKVGTMTRLSAKALNDELLQIKGVKEAFVLQHEGVAFVRFDKNITDKQALLTYSTNQLTGDKSDGRRK